MNLPLTGLWEVLERLIFAKIKGAHTLKTCLVLSTKPLLSYELEVKCRRGSREDCGVEILSRRCGVLSDTKE